MAQGFKRTTAMTLSAIMTVNLCTVGLSTPALANEITQEAKVQKISLSDILSKSRFTINNNPYMTRLKAEYNGEFKFQLAFNEEDDAGNILMTGDDGHEMMDKAEIQINDGNIWSFKDAEIVLANYGNGEANSSFESKNLDFIREFVEADELKVAIKDYEGNLVEGVIENKSSEDERKQFVEDYDSALETDVDKSALENVIARAEALNLDEYTPATASVVSLHLADRKSVV